MSEIPIPAATTCGSPAPFESALVALQDVLPGLAAGSRVEVVGTSGGFMGYAMASASGPSKAAPVVISNSDLLKTADDDRAPAPGSQAQFGASLPEYRRQGITLLPDL